MMDARNRGIVIRLIVAVVLLAWSRTLFAQTTDAAIDGRVLDAAGRPVVGAAIVVEGATVTRSVASDSQGHYRVVALPPGRYTIEAAQPPLPPQRIESIEITVNRTVTVNIQMAALTETVDVHAPSHAIDVRSSSLSYVVTATELASIPLNGRNYLDLALLTPGVSNTGTRTDLSDLDTRGAILGERGANAAFLVDGIENNDDFRGGVLQNYTLDAVQEFEVIGAGYKAEFGHGSGGIINVVTKSGTNDVGGAASVFVRNDRLDTSNMKGSTVPDLARYDAAATAGGPLRREHSWYFGAFEHLFERRQSIFPSDIPATLLAGEDFSQRPEATTDRLFGKYTRALQPGHDLRAEVSWSRTQNVNQLTTASALPSAGTDNDTRTAIGSLAYTAIVGPRLLVEASGGYRDQHFDQDGDLGDGISTTVAFTDGGGTFDVGPRYAAKQTLDQRYTEGKLIVSLFAGTHSAKAGIAYLRTAVDGVNGQGLQNIIPTTAANFARYGFESFQIPQGTGFIAPGDDRSRMRNNGVGLFAQDDWTPVPTLTFNVGVRYDNDSKFPDSNNLAPRLGVAWSPDGLTVVRASWGLFYDRYRLGLAQAVPALGGFNGKTVAEMDYPRLAVGALNSARSLGRLAATLGDPFVLQTHFGIPRDAVVSRANIQALTGLTPDQFLTALNQFIGGYGVFLPVDFSPSTGYLRQDLSAAFQDRVSVARPFKTPYNRTFTIGGERIIFGDTTVGATYVRRAMRNILGVRLTNLSPASRVAGTAITTDGGPIDRSYGPWYDGNYDGLIFSIDTPFNGRYHLQASYTYARATDDLLNSNLALGVGAQGAGAVPTDNLDLEFDRGHSDFAVPHTVVVSGLLALPAGLSLSGLLRGTSGAYFSAVSGTPYDYDGDGISSLRPADTVRNQFSGPKTMNVDARLERRFTVGGVSVSALVECFNLFNARNPRTIENGYTAAGPVAAFGTVRVPFPGRETQLGLRLQF
jgi:outer membrane receptor protein involved in Fe transport